MTLAKLFKKTERKDLTFPLTGKFLIVNPKNRKEQYRTRRDLVVRAYGGFGCQEDTIGGAVFCEDIDGGTERLYRSDFVAEFNGTFENV